MGMVFQIAGSSSQLIIDATRIAALSRDPDPSLAMAGQVGSQVKMRVGRSEEHTSELQSLMRISYAVFCLKKKKPESSTTTTNRSTQQVSKNKTPKFSAP